MENENINIDHLFRDALDNYRETPPGGSWEQLQPRLQEGTGDKKIFYPWIWIIFLLTIIPICVLVYGYRPLHSVVGHSVVHKIVRRISATITTKDFSILKDSPSFSDRVATHTADSLNATATAIHSSYSHHSHKLFKEHHPSFRQRSSLSRRHTTLTKITISKSPGSALSENHRALKQKRNTPTVARKPYLKPSFVADSNTSVSIGTIPDKPKRFSAKYTQNTYQYARSGKRPKVQMKEIVAAISLDSALGAHKRKISNKSYSKLSPNISSKAGISKSFIDNTLVYHRRHLKFTEGDSSRASHLLGKIAPHLNKAVVLSNKSSYKAVSPHKKKKSFQIPTQTEVQNAKENFAKNAVHRETNDRSTTRKSYLIQKLDPSPATSSQNTDFTFKKAKVRADKDARLLAEKKRDQQIEVAFDSLQKIDKDISTNGDADSSEGSGSNVPTLKGVHRPFSLTIDAILGYQFGFRLPHANRTLIGTSFKYNISRSFSLLFEPTYQFGSITGFASTGDSSYYKVDTSIIYSSFDSNNSGFHYHYLRNLVYDSIVSSSSLSSAKYWQISLPLILQYHINEKWYLLAGVSLDFNNSIALTHSSVTFNKSFLDSIESSVPLSPSQVNAHHLPGGTLYSVSPTGDMSLVNSVKLGYILGIGYSFNKLSLDVRLSQIFSGTNTIANSAIKSIYSQPYIRISIGYQLFSFGKHKPVK